MKFDLRSFPIESIPFSSRYMEAKLLEDIKSLQVIYENYQENRLTSSEAISLINMVGKSEDELIKEACDADNILSNMTESVSLPTVPLEFMETVIPYKEIMGMLSGNSKYKVYTTEHTWDTSTTVGIMCENVACSKEKQFYAFVESKGKDGFTGMERKLYASYPDDRLNRSALYEAVIYGRFLAGEYTMEDASIMRQFVAATYEDGCVAQLMPVVGLTGVDPEAVNSNATVNSMVANVDADANGEEAKNGLLPEEGTDNTLPEETAKILFTGVDPALEYVRNALWKRDTIIAMESAVYKNNITFDSFAKKLFMKLQDNLKLKNPDDPNESFKSCLNMQKNRYNFAFRETSLTPEQIQSTITTCGVKPIKENGIIIRYETTLKGILITVEFTSIDSGIIVYYVQAKTESSDDMSPLEKKIRDGIDCDDSDVKKAAKYAYKLYMNKDTEKEKLEEAVNAFEHIFDNYKDVQKAQKEKTATTEAVHDTLGSLRKEHELITEWMNEGYGDYLQHDHPYFGKPKEDVMDVLESTMNEIKEVLSIGFTKEGLVNDRKTYLEKACEENGYYVYNTDDFLLSVLTESPTNSLFRATYDVMEGCFDSSLTEEDYEKKVATFLEVYKMQKDQEAICETVLTQAEQMEDLYEESSDKEIDDDIKECVETLNRLGYTVKYSCSGHPSTRIKEDRFGDGVYNGKLYTTARITFSKNYSFSSLPKGWYVNPNSDKTAIYVRALVYDQKDGTPRDAFYKWKRSYMEALKDWVKELKPESEVDSKRVTESVINNLEDEIMQSLMTPVAPIEKNKEVPDIFTNSLFDIADGE